ncbi:alpha/beta fold hydrolase [Sediminicurvatus halobius]|uniref:Alpha/beta hydrolase n=1 Tax=Sediminicurvatus halobius TaxID=2182432 RepID=A0A2U2MWB1_9GAMM|nr:alpha/beta hydrolase [Spiribacter halobius]PWG61134.1 alpha/beta hydrolase [Spiribacter halobius]UEX77706.1 alpha/beta hydrolase [Spiribacter halobius]
MAFVETEGAQVEYLAKGTGRGLVLVHGTGGSAEANWTPLVSTLRGERRVVRPNYSGSGQTVDNGARLTVDYLARQVLAAADAADAGTFDLVGFSLGAGVAAHIAATRPERIGSVVLINGFASCEDPRLRFQFEHWLALAERDPEAMARLGLLTGFSPGVLSGFSREALETMVADTVRSTDPLGLARQIQMDLDLDVRAELPAIRQRTLVIGSEDDYMVPAVHARAMARAIPGARFMTLPGGHLMPMETPETLSRIIEDFIDGAIYFET